MVMVMGTGMVMGEMNMMIINTLMKMTIIMNIVDTIMGMVTATVEIKLMIILRAMIIAKFTENMQIQPQLN